MHSIQNYKYRSQVLFPSLLGSGNLQRNWRPSLSRYWIWPTNRHRCNSPHNGNHHRRLGLRVADPSGVMDPPCRSETTRASPTLHRTDRGMQELRRAAAPIHTAANPKSWIVEVRNYIGGLPTRPYDRLCFSIQRCPDDFQPPLVVEKG